MKQQVRQKRSLKTDDTICQNCGTKKEKIEIRFLPYWWCTVCKLLTEYK